MALACLLLAGFASVVVARRMVGLALALGFALLVNRVVVDQFGVDRGFWGEVCCCRLVGGRLFWMVSLGIVRPVVPATTRKSAIQLAEDLFPRALDEYLQGTGSRSKSFATNCWLATSRCRSSIVAGLDLPQTGKFDEARERSGRPATIREWGSGGSGKSNRSWNV